MNKKTAALVSAVLILGPVVAAMSLVRPAMDHYQSARGRAAALEQRISAIENGIARIADIAAQAKRVAVDLKGQSAPVKIERLDERSLTPVSMTRIGTDEFLIANYRNIYLFDAAKREAYPVKIDRPPPVWAPTAVYYSAFYDRLFIANYTGKDVIIAKLDRSRQRLSLSFEERLTDNIAGPEGVSISNGGRYMALADYTGNSVSLFERVSGSWRFRWKQPVIASHGVAFAGDAVFASGKTLAKFDVKTGTELARVDKLAGDPIQFATCIDYDERTSGLIVSDTMAGRVFTVASDLTAKEYFGANGPTFNNLSMPYCAYRDMHSTFVLSTYQERIIRMDKDGTTSFEFGDGRWDYDQSIALHPPLETSGLRRTDYPLMELFGKTAWPSYGSLLATDGTLLDLPSRTGQISTPWPYYLVSAAQDGDWLLITSNSSPGVLLLNRKTNEMGVSTIGEQDCWAMARDIACPSRRYGLGELLAGASFAQPDSKLSKESALAYLKGSATEYALEDYWQAVVRSRDE